MDGIRDALLDPNVVIAWITAVLGPIAATLVTWATTRRRAEKAAKDGRATPSPDGEKSITEEVTDWARELRKDVRGLRTEVHTLRSVVRSLEAEKNELAARVTELERENHALAAHNRLLVSQIVDLGGEPWRMPSDD